MANIEKRTNSKGETSYRAKVRLRGHPIETATFSRLTDAKKWVQDTESAIREGRYFKHSQAKKRTLNECIDRYIKEVLPSKPKSHRDQERQLNWWKANIGAYFLGCRDSWKTLDSELSAIGADNLPAQLEEQKRTLLLQIEEKSHKFMQLSAGVLLAGEALRSYREMHRSSMMKAASEAFVCMTRGAFKKLDAIPRDNTEVLVDIKADGSSIVANEMSRGTRYQLYLALRIVGHAEFARQGKTLPFFADDILEPFDDDRSRETFSLLNSMSKNGQVVYLTHHQHLCDLAKSVTNGQVVV